MKFEWIFACLVLLLAAGLCHGAPADRTAEWNALVDEYLNKVYFPTNPTGATSIGVHRYDGDLEDYSAAARRAEARRLHDYETKVSRIPSDGLNAVDRADRQILLGNIQSQLLTIESIRPPEKNPDIYSGQAANSIYVLMIRNFAPSESRLRSVVSRERKIPGVLEEARKNLQHPPRIFTEIAIEQLPGIIEFFQDAVPGAFKNVTDAGLKAEFATSNARVVIALKSYQNWLKTDLLARSDGDFRIGAENFSKKLRYEEMVALPLDRLLEIGTQDLRNNQAEFRRVAADIDPNKSSLDVMQDLAAMHPAPDRLLDTFRGTFDGLIAFIGQKHIITIPDGPKPILQETPPFERATTTASMDTPGPLETVAQESYFNVTLPVAGDSPEQIASLMASFNVGTIVSTSAHETYPGHYMQYLWTPRAPSKLRKILSANTNVEGWAHYCEQMILEQGYGQPGTGAKDATEAKYLHLGQLQDALLRDARFVVGIQLHTGRMTLEQAKAFFEKEGYQPAKISDIETKRATSDPTYLYYTLGKLQILKLREDYKNKLGLNYTIGKFHDQFMGQGFPPIAVIRQAMLGDNSPVL